MALSERLRDILDRETRLTRSPQRAAALACEYRDVSLSIPPHSRYRCLSSVDRKWTGIPYYLVPLSRGIGQAAEDRLSALRCPTACRVCGVLLMAQPCPKLSPHYQPRDPQASDLWRVIDEHFDAFHQVYDERFQAKYGYWRPIVQQCVEAFLKCGYLQEGFARVGCPDCYQAMFVAFSCKQRCTCPSCHQERSSLTAMHVCRRCTVFLSHIGKSS